MLEIALDERHVRDSNREYWERLIRDHAGRLSQTGDGLQRRAGALQDRLEMLLELASTGENLVGDTGLKEFPSAAFSRGSVAVAGPSYRWLGWSLRPEVSALLMLALSRPCRLAVAIGPTAAPTGSRIVPRSPVAAQVWRNRWP
jgi:hypothetical protein